MKITHLSNSDIIGGAGIASYRIHKALLKRGYNSKFYANNKHSGDDSVYGPINQCNKLATIIRPQIIKPLKKLLVSNNKIVHSLGIIPSAWPKRLNKSDTDLVHLHWVQNEMMSIEDIGNIKKPIVMHMHDMWPFCGAEHLSYDSRWEKGYLKRNRPKSESGIDLNRYIWNLKRKHWKKPFFIISPSDWMANCVKRSKLMHSWPCKVIPNCIDTTRWKPINKSYSRKLLNLPDNNPILLFGTYNSNNQYHKGIDLLKKVLKVLKTKKIDLNLVIFGQHKSENIEDFGFPTFYVGKLKDSYSLKALYNSSDILIVPSRIESFCNTAAEAHACGVPVVSFKVGGLTDIISHKKTGYLADSFNIKDFSHGIVWVLEQLLLNNKLNIAARKKALNLWDYSIIANHYQDAYQEILEKK